MIDVTFKSIQDFARRLSPEAARRVAEETFNTLAGGASLARERMLECLDTSWPNARNKSWTAASDVVRSGDTIQGVMTVAHPWVAVIAGGAVVPPHPIVSDRPMHLRVGKGGEEPKRWKRGPRAGTSPVVIPPGKMLVHPGYKGKDCVTRSFRAGALHISKRMTFLLRQLARAVGGK